MSLYCKLARRWLKAIEIAKILFEEEKYCSTYLNPFNTENQGTLRPTAKG